MSSTQQQEAANSEPATALTADPHNNTTSAQQQASMTEPVQDEASSTADKRQQLAEEERKLASRHASVQQRPVSEFLQKRLQRGQKYFDSGDYNMAKASTNPNIKLPQPGTPVSAIDGKLLNKQRH